MKDQRQKVVTVNFAPSYQHVFGASTLLTVHPFVRQDRINYYPTSNRSFDAPATIDQERRLTNWGTRVDLSHVHRAHNLKFGAQIMQTRLNERFALGSPIRSSTRPARPSLSLPPARRIPAAAWASAPIRSSFPASCRSISQFQPLARPTPITTRPVSRRGTSST